MPTRLVQVTIDAADPERQARFWSQVFGWQTQAMADGEVMILPGGWRYPDPGPLPLLFVPASEPRPGRNRVHIDVPTKSPAFFEDEVKRIIGLGATPADIGQGDVPWEVLADPEGNELCILDPRPGVYFDTGPLAAVVLGCADPAAIAGFWTQASGFRRSESRSTPDTAVMRTPVVRGPFLELIRDPGAAAAVGRVRLDVAPPADGDLDEAVTELLTAGARPADGEQAKGPAITLSDPEGFDFRVLTPR
ncbi:MAG TPA: VOC family protein [Trebonia sp.]|nr:VOC family protein [Trebonia sp.]